MPIGDLLAQIGGHQPKPSTTSTFVAPLKRKADGDLPRHSDKSSRNEYPATASPSVATPVQKASGTSASMSRPVRPLPGRSSASTTPVTKSTSAPPGSAPSQISRAKVPKKGSFAEIMARAKAAQTNMTQVGKIQHKRIEKGPTKREREEMKSTSKGATGKAKRKGPTPPLRDGRNCARENGRGSRTTSAEAEKRPKKAAAATTGYTGTARPNLAAAKKPQPSYGSSGRDRDRPSPGPSRPQYTYAASEDEEDYESDVSSDMEAAAYEVDEEEERAARYARKEDALALAEENRLKMEKEEKRKKLAAMARNRR
ncbi:hypothetical protein VC83_08615 [Pseudogymnoascus destructans]|uniref:SPT2 chromatin protein n=2 Tax=Pseudogymnoascus destructans TaxID=655981 RepID=L8FS83_PSED2|nr:uncharacterized protein VC83_08615 [Pseudogymnoascus destructans]ELR03338.1 hypothetical protein GMDG_06085 [Pseudogymnoascus destructans 20631-21]OAF54883.1 hypothetical protein VC83_08615 [Pseudogymnoascus destructans]